MKRINLRRLQLSTLSIRLLSNQNLESVHGGIPRSNIGCSGSCNTCYVTNCASACEVCVPASELC